jgi:hypothetical protein
LISMDPKILLTWDAIWSRTIRAHSDLKLTIRWGNTWRRGRMCYWLEPTQLSDRLGTTHGILFGNIVLDWCPLPLCHSNFLISWNQDTVGIVTGYRLDNWGVGVWGLVGSRIFSS